MFTGTFSLDGEVTTGMLGADYAHGKWLVVLVLMQGGGAMPTAAPIHAPLPRPALRTWARLCATARCARATAR